MPEIYYDVDAALSEVPVNIMPLLDSTDFVTIEADVNYNATGLALIWHFVTTAGAYSQTAVTPTDTGGNYDWVEQGNGMFTIEIPASGGATINNDTEGFGWFTGVATGILPWRGPVIGFRAAGINDKLIDSAYSATRGLAGTALPDAAADAAGGLPISDAGALDLDAQIGTDIDAILADTNELQTDDTPGAIAALNDLSSGDVETAVGTALATYDPPTNAEMEARTLVAASYFDPAADVVAHVTLVDTTTTNTDMVAAAPSAADVADAVWDEASTGHVDAGKAGQQLWTDVDAILADTNELQTDDTPGAIAALNDLSAGDVETAVGTALATYDGPTNAEMEARTIVAANYATAAALDAVDNFLDTEVAAILEDTNELQTDWHDGGRLDLLLDGAASAGDPWTTALPGAYGAGTAGKIVGDNIDAAISSRLATAGYTAPDNASIASILEDTNELQTDDVPGAIAALNDLSSADAQSAAAAALTAYDPPTNAEMEARTLIAASYFDPAADVVAHVTLVDTTTTNTDMVSEPPTADVTAIKAVTDKLDTALVQDGAVYDFTAAALAAAPSGSGATAEEVRIEMDANSTQLAAIVEDTDELQTDWANGGRLDTILDAAGSAGDPWITELPGDYGAGTAGYIMSTILNRIGGFTGSGVNTILGFLKALMSKAASTPSDVGGTFSAATDSTEALRDHLSNAVTVSTTSVANGGTITLYNQADLSQPIELGTSIAVDDELYFSLKRKASDDDDDALLMLSRTGGLLVVNGDDPTLAANGSITVTDAAAGDITVAVEASELTGLSESSGLVWDVKRITAAGAVNNLAIGDSVIRTAPTKAIT